MIPENIIEEMRQRMDLVAFVEQVTPLTRVGSNFKACCPFHDEKTPSFHINASKQLFHCFGCGVGGSVYNFIMLYHHLSFPEALEFVAKETGTDLEPFKKNKQPQDHKNIRSLLDYASNKFHSYLVDHKRAQKARDYLKNRDVSFEAIETYALGYVPEGWDNLVKALARDGKSMQLAVKAGLIAKKKSSSDHYDVFRHRLMIPIHDPNGNIIGFGARTMGDEQPKYLNSPQTVFFDKSKVLFGLHKADPAIRKAKNVFVVEGYFDQISLFDQGVENVIATMGTALTGYHCSMLKRFTPRVTLVFDGDRAGMDACKKASRSVLAYGLNADVMIMPQGKDPDDVIREKGPDAFLALPTKDLLDYLIEHYYQNVTDVTLKTRFLKDMVEIVGDAKTPFIAKVLKDDLSNRLGLDPAVFKEGPSWTRKKAPLPAQDNTQEKSLKVSKESVMALVIASEHPEVLSGMDPEVFLAFLTDPFLQNHAQSCFDTNKTPQDPTKWIDQWNNPAYRNTLSEVLAEMDLKTDQNTWQRTWKDCLMKLKKNRVHHLAQEIKRAEAQGQTSQLETLSKQMIETKRFQPATTL